MEHYFIHRNDGNAVFVKEAEFFKFQGGLTKPWGRAWELIQAESIEHARRIGELLLPKAGEVIERGE